MAKMYKYPEGGAFYDAFGGKIGEVEEIWAGDSFERSALDCCYTTADTSNAISAISAKPATLSFTVDNCNWNTDALATLAKGECIIGNSGIEFKAVTDVDTVTDRFAELQKQIDELRDKIKVESKLRSELRTLKYTREVE